MDGKETVTIETSYDELIRHAAATQKHHPLGFINIDKFSPSFSW
jgi:hypothetical protein